MSKTISIPNIRTINDIKINTWDSTYFGIPRSIMINDSRRSSLEEYKYQRATSLMHLEKCFSYFNFDNYHKEEKFKYRSKLEKEYLERI